MNTDEIISNAERCLDKGDVAGAERALTEHWRDVSKAPADVTHLLGMIALERQHFGDAEKFMRDALREEPKALRHHIALGHILSAAGDHARAFDAYAQAAQIDATWPNLLMVLSRAACSAGKAADAEKAARQSIAQAPSALGWDALCNALRLQGKGQEALAAADEALCLNPKNPSVRHSQGASLLMLGRGQEALVIFEALAAEGQDGPVLAVNLGTALEMVGRHKDADAVFDEALKRWPAHANMRGQIAQRRRR